MVNLTNELAKERNRAAAERTMMAWIRTCLSLISFGFGLDKIINAINRSRFDNSDHAGLSVRLVSIGFVLIGVLAMTAATRQHLRMLKLIRRDDFVYVDQGSITVFTAVSLTVIGIVAFALLVTGTSVG
ncbi:MAG: YidH family protein [Cyanobacteriota bacterium]|jgi:putative membrane protein